MYRKALSLTAAGVVALTAGSSIALAGGGNSANAQTCQKGEWMKRVRADQTLFTNQGGCVSYAAQGGGTLTFPGPSD